MVKPFSGTVPGVVPAHAGGGTVGVVEDGRPGMAGVVVEGRGF